MRVDIVVFSVEVVGRVRHTVGLEVHIVLVLAPPIHWSVHSVSALRALHGVVCTHHCSHETVLGVEGTGTRGGRVEVAEVAHAGSAEDVAVASAFRAVGGERTVAHKRFAFRMARIDLWLLAAHCDRQSREEGSHTEGESLRNH